MLRKAELISLLRSHNESTLKLMAQKQLDPEESDNEVDSPSNDPRIMEEGAQFDPEESDNEE